jgi:hypothetical protein
MAVLMVAFTGFPCQTSVRSPRCRDDLESYRLQRGRPSQADCVEIDDLAVSGGRVYSPTSPAQVLLPVRTAFLSEAIGCDSVYSNNQIYHALYSATCPCARV